MSNTEINDPDTEGSQVHPMATVVLEQISTSIEGLLKKKMEDVLDQALAERIPGLIETVFNSVASQLDSRTGDAPPAIDEASTDAQAGNTDNANTATNAQGGLCQAQNVVVAGGSANAMICQNCGHAVPLAAGDERWYCVWRARRIGWVKSSDTVIDLTRGVKGAAYKFCASEAAARAVFLTKQEQKVTAVLSDHEDVSFMLPVERGCLFP